ncbi:MAG: hypothetical protein M0Q44_17780 [Methylobacter sp.]|jgi:hypothetical protein|nr:hypothetical protein [Methylobacter sp.]
MDLKPQFEPVKSVRAELLSKHERFTRLEHSKIPLTLRQAQGERDFGMLNCGFLG